VTKIILAASLLTATIIGAGVFVLPYVFQQSGFLIGLLYLIIFTITFSYLHLIYADINLCTPGNHRFVGLAKIYLGERGRLLTALTTISGSIFILTIYLVLAISFLNLFFPFYSNIQKFSLFWFISSITIFWGINRLAMSEFFIVVGIVLIITTIFVFGFQNFNNFLAAKPILNLMNIFIPYGPILFSLSGRPAVAAVIDYFKKNGGAAPDKIKKSIIIGTCLPAIIYLIFIIGTINISKTVTKDTISGITGEIPAPILLLLGIFGLIAIWSTYIVIGRDVRKILETDFRVPDLTSRILVFIMPLLVYFIISKDFLTLIKITGGIFISLESILVILIWKKMQQKNSHSLVFQKFNPFFVYILIIIFLLGIITELSLFTY
jgi:amino acid permease